MLTRRSFLVKGLAGPLPLLVAGRVHAAKRCFHYPGRPTASTVVQSMFEGACERWQLRQVEATTSL
jgi:hypothetical protein